MEPLKAFCIACCNNADLYITTGCWSYKGILKNKDILNYVINLRRHLLRNKSCHSTSVMYNISGKTTLYHARCTKKTKNILCYAAQHIPEIPEIKRPMPKIWLTKESGGENELLFCWQTRHTNMPQRACQGVLKPPRSAHTIADVDINYSEALGGRRTTAGLLFWRADHGPIWVHDRSFGRLTMQYDSLECSKVFR